MANPPALSFDEIIKADRKKKAAQELAQDILGSRRSTSSGPGALSTRKQPAVGTSLSSRVGVTKRSSSATPKPNIDGKWGHDLHHVNNPQVSRTAQLSRTSSASSIERGNRLYSDIQRDVSNGGASSQATIRTGTQMSIRGMARSGPYVVVASNFALGTTAEDIEAAMEPVGGEIQSCRLISSRPTVMCELIFTNKEGADNVVATFNNQKADGRLLYVYHKQGGPSPRLHPLQDTAPASAPATPAPVAEASGQDPPKGPRELTPVEAPAARDERDLMDVDNNVSASSNNSHARDHRHDDRDRYRTIELERDRDRNGNNNGRYGFRGQFEWRNERRDYGRDRGPRGGRLYSDGMYSNDRRYRP